MNTNEIKVPRVQEVNHNTFNRNMIALIAEAATAQIIEKNGGSIEKLMPSGKKLLDSIERSLEYLMSGIPFTGYANFNGEMITFIMASGSRARYYNVTASSCQCESHQHNGYCVHRTTWGLFNNYFKLVRADEDRARKYAEVGITVQEDTYFMNDGRQIEVNNVARSGDPLAGVPSHIAGMVRDLIPPGFQIEDVRFLGPDGQSGVVLGRTKR
jgi:hypothetical protein